MFSYQESETDRIVFNYDPVLNLDNEINVFLGKWKIPIFTSRKNYETEYHEVVSEFWYAYLLTEHCPTHLTQILAKIEIRHIFVTTLYLFIYFVRNPIEKG